EAAANSKHSRGSSGNSSTCFVSPCEAYAQASTSDCWVRVGMPVDGPPRCTLRIVTGISAKYARPMNSFISDTPGPAVVAKARARAVPAGADHHADRRDLVLGLDHRETRPALLVDAVLLAILLESLGQRRRRRDRIPGANRRAAVNAAERGGGVAFDEDPVAD